MPNQQISYNGWATTLLEHVNLTLMGVGKKKEELPGSHTALLK